jgi:hypothetical protein
MDDRADTLSVAIRTLYALVEGANGSAVLRDSLPASVAGHRFEDEAVKAAYQALVRVGVAPLPPRHTLQLPTISGLYQQFDVVVPDRRRYFIVELKRRSHSEIEQLFAFVAKLLDYAIAAQIQATGHTFTGLFVSTASRLNDRFRQFAISYGVIPLAVDLPPCQVIEERTNEPGLLQDAADFARRLSSPLPKLALQSPARVPPSLLLAEWKSIAQRCSTHETGV